MKQCLLPTFCYYCNFGAVLFCSRYPCLWDLKHMCKPSSSDLRELEAMPHLLRFPFLLLRYVRPNLTKDQTIVPGFRALRQKWRKQTNLCWDFGQVVICFNTSAELHRGLSCNFCEVALLHCVYNYASRN